jgi:hypothetical protein
MKDFSSLSYLVNAMMDRLRRVEPRVTSDRSTTPTRGPLFGPNVIPLVKIRVID